MTGTDDAIIKRPSLLEHTVMLLTIMSLLIFLCCFLLSAARGGRLQKSYKSHKILFRGVAQKLQGETVSCLQLDQREKITFTTTLFRVRTGLDPGNPAKLTFEMMQLLYYSWLLLRVLMNDPYMITV